MPGIQGISQADIPKLMKLIGDGRTVVEICNGMVGFRAPASTIESFFVKHEQLKKDAKSKKKRAVSQHPQDRAAEAKALAKELAEKEKIAAERASKASASEEG